MDDSAAEDLRQWVLDFLKDFKELMGQGHYRVEGHDKNLQSLSELGITFRQRDELIYSIALRDYSSGPNNDEYNPGHYYWVFGKEFNSIEIYIKLKIVTYNNGNEKAVCVSFHPSEYPMKFPFCPEKHSTGKK